MTTDKRPRERGTAVRAERQDDWSLEGKSLSKRVPRFAAFVEPPEGGEDKLTDKQQEFLDKFSSGLEEAISKGAIEPAAEDHRNQKTAKR